MLKDWLPLLVPVAVAVTAFLGVRITDWIGRHEDAASRRSIRQ